MFKLLKDLTRPPEPLSPRLPSHSDHSAASHHPHSSPVPRLRGRASPAPSRQASPVTRVIDLPDDNPPTQELEGDGKKVRELLEALDTVKDGVMGYVEILSQLNSIRCNHTALQAFRIQKGFPRLFRTLKHLAASSSVPDEGDDERHVEQVQRMEGLRMWFEVLGWALRERESTKAFEALGGYMALLDPLRELSAPLSSSSTAISSMAGSSASSSMTVTAPPVPDPKILSHLLAYIFNNNYTLLSIFSKGYSETVDIPTLTQQLGDVNLSRPRALSLLWSYIWGTPSHLPSKTRKGKDKAGQPQWSTANGKLESESGRDKALEMTFGIMYAAAQSSIANLFALCSSLPFLPRFLLDRLYGPEQERKYEITFPARDDWYVPETNDGNASLLEDGFEWTAPQGSLRTIYLDLLRRLLDGGVDQTVVWRLFTLVKTTAEITTSHKPTVVPKGEEFDSSQDKDYLSPPVVSQDFAGSDRTIDDSTSSITSTSAISGSNRHLAPESPRSPGLVDTSAPTTPTPDPSSSRKPRIPRLTIDPSPQVQRESLNTEILDLIRHAMKARWPDSFLFRGLGTSDECGIELRDMGRSWPHPAKGFNFSCWIYISKLNRPITLLHVSQANQSHPLFQLRILENSQVSVLASVYRPESTHPPQPQAAASQAANGSVSSAQTPAAPSPAESSEETPVPDEIICSAPDALIAHGQWVHFSVGCRKPKGLELAEARIFVNGVRVGAMRLHYPVPAPPGPATQHVLHSKPASSADAIRLSVGKPWKLGKGKEEEKLGLGREEENEFLLGRTLFVEDVLPEDIVLLFYHLGPRYHGNFHDPLGKFLTYEAATSINVYLSAQAAAADDKSLFTSKSNSDLVKAIRQGSVVPEEHILLSLISKDATPSDVAAGLGAQYCINGAVPHPVRAAQLRHGIASIVGPSESILPFSNQCLDDSVTCVGGGAVVLKMIDMAKTSEELAITLGILRDMLKHSWAASEEMERIRGFDLLAAILRPKMVNLVDIPCTKIILAMLGINMDRPNAATVHNSAAYRALGLEFELWSRASLGVVTLYLQHFEYLLATSKHARYNVLRTFQKAAMVRKMLYALRSNLFDLAVVPVVVDTLKLVLLARWSGADAIKPTFSYLISALCQSPSSVYPSAITSEPPASQAPAAQILSMIAGLTHNGPRLVKLNRSIALHRLLVIFISSNSAPYVIIPCLDILERCILTSGLESFQRSFEAEGGFALLARTLGPVWTGDIQARVLRMLTGPSSSDGKTLLCPTLISAVLSALDCLLQTGDDPFKPSRRGSMSSIRSVSMTPMATTTDLNGVPPSEDTRLEDLLRSLTALYRSNSLFRRTFTNRRVEQMLPALVDFAAMSSSSPHPERTNAQRSAAAEWLQAIIDKHKISHSLISQIKLVIEQLRSPIITTSPPASSSQAPSPRPSSVHLARSFTGRMGTTPPPTPSPSGPIPRRRPSTDASFSPFPAQRFRAGERKAPSLKRVLTGESILEGGKDKNAAWKLIIIQTVSDGIHNVSTHASPGFAKPFQDDSREKRTLAQVVRSRLATCRFCFASREWPVA
ncbi:hypothetical protein BD324DRAFT_427167 [Kockovaella imperatae]|uniref:Uncharacterized protein n=1 Tax=Kockovaella imperatae TaxID=4999 RepID=A0A1Y1UI22_9TREE|nr:hypothetical protein BD324DRAFT_427167 [Kockovaella imperatae]ORX37124.1 hypothetical protein BD324DRAFT_427167 [Kockovaella imperatae]